MVEVAAESVDDELEPPEQPVVERDPTGRYLRYDQILGRGAFKTVYKGFDEEEGREIAWNQVRVRELVVCKEDKERLFAEIRVLKQLKHKNIMTFFDSWYDQKEHTVNFITELFTSGTLRQYRKRHRQLDSEVLKIWAWQILCGLVYLHGHMPPIIHMDLKSDNVFINGCEGVVKIGDLGLATLLRARTAPQSVLGTPEFMAPELYEEEYDARVDVYSFGMCLLELATLEYPYRECKNAAQIYRKVTLGIRPAALQKVVSQDLAEFVSLCIRPISERPHARQLLKHAYFDSIRQNMGALKLGMCTLAKAGGNPAELMSDAAGELCLSGPCSLAGDAPLDQDVNEISNGHHSGELPLPNDGSLSARLRHRTVSEGNEIFALADELARSQLQSSMSDEAEAVHQPSEAGTTVPMTGEREFRVQGHLQDDTNRLNLRLRILQPDGSAKVVEFDYDLAEDTAMSVASEMVEEMSLSKEDAAHIAAAIFQEIFDLTQRSSPRGPDSGPRSVALSHCAGASEASDADHPHAHPEHHHHLHHHHAAGSLHALGGSDSSSPSRSHRGAHASSHSALDSLLPPLPPRSSAERLADSHVFGQAPAEHETAAAGSKGPVAAIAGLASTVTGIGPINSLSTWLAGPDSEHERLEQPASPAPARDPALQQAPPAAEAPDQQDRYQPTFEQQPQHEQQPAAQHSMPATEASSIACADPLRHGKPGQLTPETASYGTPAAALSVQTCTSPRSPEPDPAVVEAGKLNSQALTDMLSSASQTVDRRLPMQKLFEHLEDHFIVDRRDGHLHLSNGSKVALDTFPYSGSSAQDLTSPTSSTAAHSDFGPRANASDPGHLWHGPPASGMPLRGQTHSASVPAPFVRPRSATADHASLQQRRLHQRSGSSLDLTQHGLDTGSPRNRSQPNLHRVSSPGLVPSWRAGPASSGREGEGLSSPSSGCVRTIAEKEQKRKAAAEAALARVRDMEAKFQGMTGLSSASRSCMSKDPGVPLRNSRHGLI